MLEGRVQPVPNRDDQVSVHNPGRQEKRMETRRGDADDLANIEYGRPSRPDNCGPGRSYGLGQAFALHIARQNSAISKPASRVGAH